jgi:hypothetical protein
MAKALLVYHAGNAAEFESESRRTFILFQSRDGLSAIIAFSSRFNNPLLWTEAAF